MKYLAITLFLFISIPTFAQIKAVTERGDTIYVYDNGTWSFEELDSSHPAPNNELAFLQDDMKFDTSSVKFVYNPKTNKEAKSNLAFYKIKYNSKTWERVPPATYNEDAEFAFKAKGKDIYCVAISEEVEIGTANIAKIAINMMRENTGATVNVKKMESRNVNDSDVVHGSYQVDLQGMDLMFDSYYFSNASGTIQFTVWTGTNLHVKYKDFIEDFLNGLVVTK